MPGALQDGFDLGLPALVVPLYGGVVTAPRALSQPAPTKSATAKTTPKSRRAPAAGAEVARSEVPAIGRVLRHAREHRGLSLREVERITGRSNAYLSQVERGVIKSPDPLVLLELADLYRLDFDSLAEWAGLEPGVRAVSDRNDAFAYQTFKRLLRLVKQLNARQQAQVLAVVEDVLRSP